MRTIKPACLSAITRCIEHRGHFFLGVSVITHIPMRSIAHLGAEQTLWPMLAKYAPGFIEDAIPRIRSEYFLYGNVYPPTDKQDAEHVDFGLRLATLSKKARAFGRRVVRGSSLVAKEPVGITKIIPENAYGGPDYSINSRGAGHPSCITEKDLLYLPTLELLTHPWKSQVSHNKSALFGPQDIMHPSRQKYAGTYDSEWLENDYPGLPKDASWLLYNQATEDQQQKEPFVGDEKFDLINLRKDTPHISNQLPGISARVLISRKGQLNALEDLKTGLRTVVFLPDADSVVLVWQTQCQVERDDANDIDLLVLGFEHTHRPKSIKHYINVVNSRMDEEDGILAMLDDSPLVPEDVSYDPLLTLPKANAEKDPDSMSERLKRRIERSMQEARAEVESHGLDPDEHAPPAHLPDTQKVPPMSEIGPYMRQLHKSAEEELEKTKKQQLRQQAEIAELLDSQGMDSSLIDKEIRGEMGSVGPPAPVAPETIKNLNNIDKQAKSDGQPILEVEEMLADKYLHQQWKASDDQMLEGYRVGAHLQKPAPLAAGAHAEEQHRLISEHLENNSGLKNLDLTGANLAGFDFSGIDCRGVLLEGANLKGANLSNASFVNAVLAHADLRDANLQGCDFTKANLGNGCLNHSDARDAVFIEAELSGTQLSRVLLGNAKFTSSQLYRTEIISSDLSGADLTDAILYECNLSGSALVNALINDTQFVNCDLSGTTWNDCSGKNTVFLNATFPSCEFIGAQLPSSRWVGEIDLTGAKFDKANLENAYFGQNSMLFSASCIGANVSGCDFTECNLDQSVFRYAVMRETSLRNASLKKADLTKANLMNASLQNAQLQGCIMNGTHLYGADLARLNTDVDTQKEGVILTKARIYPKWKPPESSV